MKRDLESQALSRRAMLAGIGLAFAAPPVLFAGPSRLAFAALRQGHRIGEQHMSFVPDGDGLVVRTIAEMAVKLGPITLYRYRHEASEHWRGGRFDSLETRTNANGKLLKVVARRTEEAVEISAGGGVVRAPASALPFTHWNRKIATAPLFNPQDGKRLRETVVVAPGALTFRGDADIKDFYDAAGVWVGLVGKLSDGSTLEYRPI